MGAYRYISSRFTSPIKARRLLFTAWKILEFCFGDHRMSYVLRLLIQTGIQRYDARIKIMRWWSSLDLVSWNGIQFTILNLWLTTWQCISIYSDLSIYLSTYLSIYLSIYPSNLPNLIWSNPILAIHQSIYERAERGKIFQWLVIQIRKTKKLKYKKQNKQVNKQRIASASLLIIRYKNWSNLPIWEMSSLENQGNHVAPVFPSTVNHVNRTLPGVDLQRWGDSPWLISVEMFEEFPPSLPGSTRFLYPMVGQVSVDQNRVQLRTLKIKCWSWWIHLNTGTQKRSFCVCLLYVSFSHKWQTYIKSSSNQHRHISPTRLTSPDFTMIHPLLDPYDCRYVFYARMFGHVHVHPTRFDHSPFFVVAGSEMFTTQKCSCWFKNPINAMLHNS